METIRVVGVPVLVLLNLVIQIKCIILHHYKQIAPLNLIIDYLRRLHHNSICPSLLGAIKFREVINSLTRESSYNPNRILTDSTPSASRSTSQARRQRSGSLGITPEDLFIFPTSIILPHYQIHQLICKYFKGNVSL
ncbi:hypothetical protein O181_126298 [Austropuccinia psidii MF-1]|uniref:Uncharacterized protein n=1 Tax=Austropuccinia psidii MF-1 TaxID=1389203 RepID=A0A9Q3KS72_9BASI|nr:hypothetical protein [Austropuccinia psidii MF-1]